jgi:hypothetical protein
MIDLKTADKDIDGKSFMLMIRQQEFDYKEKQSRILSLSFRTGNMGKGEEVSSSLLPSRWEPVPPGAEAMWKIACGKR